MLDNEEREILASFAIESFEMLDDVEPRLIELLDDLDGGLGIDQDTVNLIFRLVHSMKGSAGFLGLNAVVSIAHAGETLLALFRGDDGAEFNQGHTELLCQACDLLRQLCQRIESTGSDTGFEAECKVMVVELEASIRLTQEADGQSAGAVIPASEATQEDVDFSEFEIEITPEMVVKFVQEGTDLIEEIEPLLLELEANPSNQEIMNTVFRHFHSFKGNCGFFAYVDMEKISHSCESILELIKDGRLSGNMDIFRALFQAIDFLRKGIDSLTAGGDGHIDNIDPLISVLEGLASGAMDTPVGNVSEADSVPKQTEQKAIEGGKQKTILLVEDDAPQSLLIEKILTKNNFTVICAVTGEEGLEKVKDQRIEVVISDLKLPGMSGQDMIKKINRQRPSLPIIILSSLEDAKELKALLGLGVTGFVAKPVKVAELLKHIDEALVAAQEKLMLSTPATKETAAVPKAARRDIRVDLDKLDTLVNLVGELLIAGSMVIRNPALEGLDLPGFERSAHQLTRITNELQDVAMAVRMVPVGNSFKKMKRLVHDLARKSNKKLKLVITGEDTDIDKGVLDLITDPLVHMVRNAADHGIDNAEERKAAGKPEEGTISLGAEQKGNEIWITIADDGRGLNREKILARGIENGLVEGNGDDWSDENIYRLIFEPGFSTAEAVTDISGRGVGMDVVKKNIELVKGRIDIRSVPGVGGTFTIRIPLTLATIEGMLVRVGGTLYTIPLNAIHESIRPQKEDVTVRSDGQEFVTIRGNIHPVIRLHRLHHVCPEVDELHEGILIMVETNGQVLGLFVDKILYQVQTVVKQMGAYLGDLKGISGCNILGDGDLSLILDVENLFLNLAQLSQPKQGLEAGA